MALLDQAFIKRRLLLWEIVAEAVDLLEGQGCRNEKKKKKRKKKNSKRGSELHEISLDPVKQKGSIVE